MKPSLTGTWDNIQQLQYRLISSEESDGSSCLSNTVDNARRIENAGRKLFMMPVPRDPRAEMALGQRRVTATICLVCKTAAFNSVELLCCQLGSPYA